MDSSHSYRVTASWGGERNGKVTAEGIVPSVQFSTPPEFKGDPSHWTPEHLLVAAIASCYIATFYSLAELSKLEFLGLELPAKGILGKPEGKLRFTNTSLKPTLSIAPHQDRELANRRLAKADEGCLVARSLVCRGTQRKSSRANQPEQDKRGLHEYNPTSNDRKHNKNHRG